MRRSVHSLRHALEGLVHAIATERNLRHFVICYAIVILAGFFFAIGAWEWMAVIGAGGSFITIELINTALERLVDACDELYKGSSHHRALKQTKDVASAAALVALIAAAGIIAIVFLPYLIALAQLQFS